jgi:hypothetical protein
MSFEKKLLTLLNRLSTPLKIKAEYAYSKKNFQSIHLDHLVSLSDREELLKRLPKNGVVAEIGVNEGDFSEKILTLSQPQKLILIDVWASKRYHGGLFEKVHTRFTDLIKQDRVEIVRNLSFEAIASFPDQCFDWVYLDTDHSLETTRKELELLRPKMKMEGIIAGHDYIVGNWKTGYRYGVMEAVREFCLKYHWEMIYLTHELNDHPSFAIRRIR